MSELGRLDLQPEIRGTIQNSLPAGEVVKHVTLVYDLSNVLNMDGGYELRINQEYFLVITDSLVSTRILDWEWDLTPQQQQAKQKLEKNTDFLNKGLKWVGKFGLQADAEYGKAQLDQKLIQMLAAKHGPLKAKWLPKVLAQKDFAIDEFTLLSYEELVPFPHIASQFAGRGHQVSHIASVAYSINGVEGYMNSFFADLRDVFDFARERKLYQSAQSGSQARTTKCQSCGSTELSTKGAFMVCDYCQSKYPR